MSYNENLATLRALFEGVEEGVLVWILEESGGDLQRAIDSALELTGAGGGGGGGGGGGRSPPSVPSVQTTKPEAGGNGREGREGEGKGRVLTQEEEDAELARSLHQELNVADRDAEYARQLQQSFDMEGLRPSSSLSSPSSPGARFPFPSSRLPSSSPMVSRDVGGGLDYAEEDDYEYEDQNFTTGGRERGGRGAGAERRRGGVGVGMLGLGGGGGGEGTETLSQFLEQILTDGSWFSALQPGMAHFKSMLVNIVDEQIRSLSLPGMEEDNESIAFSLGEISFSDVDVDPNNIDIDPQPEGPTGAFNLTMQGIDASINPFPWSFQKKTFPKLKDDGQATVRIRGINIAVSIQALPSPSSGVTLRVMDSKVTIKNLKLKTSGTKASFFYNTLLSLFSGKVKGMIERGIADVITNALTNG